MDSTAGQGAMRIRFSSLTVLAVVVATLIAAPVLSVFSNVLAGDTGATWSHLADTVLGEFVFNTVVLCIGVGLGVSSIGVTSAAAENMSHGISTATGPGRPDTIAW